MAIAPERMGIGIRRHFTTEGVDPYDEVVWEERDARITNYRDGTVAFEQLGVEVPATWSVNATNILAQKYFRGTLGTLERESSLRQVADRVVDTITAWGVKDGYFVDDAEAEVFRAELKHLIITQKAAFNSPVWFNIGVEGVPRQASACFILSVDDSMQSILNWYVEEGTIFKGGSGSGINLSRIRSSKEMLNGGGTASGPVSFMRGADASAGTIKCLHADTTIVTDRGEVPIREAQVGSRVLTRFGFREIEAVHDNGIRPLVKVRTALGDEILCTPEHKFLVVSGDGEQWRRAGDLRSDDYLVTDLSAPDPGELQPLVPVETRHHNEIVRDLPRVLDESFALWLGWVFGDGSITYNEHAKFISVQIGDQDPELARRYEVLVRGIFGADVRIYADRHKDKSDASSGVRFFSGQVIRFLEANGLRKQKAHELCVPPAIQRSPINVRAAFLVGLFEADGHVANGYPLLSTVSRQLAVDVHRLLLSIGIPSQLSENGDRRHAYGDRPLHVVRVVGGEGVRRFAKLVGFISERKSEKLAAAVERKANSPYESQWVLPHVAAELDAIWSSTPKAALRRALSPYCRAATPRSMSLLRARSLLERFPEDLGSSSLVDFAFGDRIYQQATVTPAAEGPTFDITVGGVHEYLVNSIITHNSGGKTRRAAKMVILNADHPDVVDFIWCKALEERKARALRDAGFDMDLDGKDSHSIQYQNANNSVRVTDEFMQAVLDDADWHLKAVTDGRVVDTIKARDLFRQMAEAAWECADPGVQFDTTINRWHTAANTGRINGSNPCSEYVHLDNSACNLASLNLLKFTSDVDVFDVEAFKAAVEVVFTAQEILVGNADYPTKAIGENARRFRQLGIGYANLGALLMAEGLPYDSDEGRARAAAITALLTGHSYATSAKTAARMGPFAGYSENKEHMLKVLRMHRDEVAKIDEEMVPTDLLSAAQQAWDEAVELGETYGVRNSQASVLAPTGCLVGGSLVATDKGLVRLRSLGNPDGEQWQELGVGVLTDEGTKQASNFYVNGLESVVDVETSRGYRISGTTKHRIKVVDGNSREWVWRRFADLQPGDVVPLALGQMIGEPQEVRLATLSDATRWTNEHGIRVPDRMDADLAELVGYYMGDGSLHSRGLRFAVTNDDLQVIDHLERLAKSLFGVQTHVRQDGGCVSVEIHSVRLVDWWKANGLAKLVPHEGHHGKGYTPHIPDAVLHSNDPSVYRAFVRGLFEADGTVTGGYPSWTTSDDALAAEVQTLLLALGFVTTIRDAVSGRGSHLNIVRLLNKATNERFVEEIGFISDRKNGAVDTSEAAQSARHDHIPVTQELIDRVAPANDRNRKVAMMEFRRSGTITRRLAEDLVAASDDAELRHLMGFFFDKIVSAELGDEELTYDISVPENVTYVANGFVSHNTIGLLMDCDTTGVEPDLGLVKTKKLVGGGTMSIVNQTVPRALGKLGYTPEQVDDIVAYIDEHKSIVGAPHLSADHLATFACSMGDNTIHYRGHLRMMGAVQPFISGAISKTVNVPEEVTVEEVEQLHIEAWKLGIKAVAMYRDNCKVAQPLSTTKKDGAAATGDAADTVTGAISLDMAKKVAELEEQLARQTVIVKQPIRERLPRRRRSSTFAFRVADCEGYVTVGEYDDGRPGEVFMKVSKQGSTLAGIMDAFAISVSIGLQNGVPLATYVKKYTNMRFEPAGMTDDPDLRIATSLVDYIFRRLAVDYLPADERLGLGIETVEERMQPTLPGVEEAITQSTSIVSVAPVEPELPKAAPEAQHSDAPYCYQCGVQMQRAGSCHACPSCGTTSGCS